MRVVAWPTVNVATVTFAGSETVMRLVPPVGTDTCTTVPVLSTETETEGTELAIAPAAGAFIGVVTGASPGSVTALVATSRPNTRPRTNAVSTTAANATSAAINASCLTDRRSTWGRRPG